MAKPHQPKRPRDVSQLARHIVAISTGEALDESPTPVKPLRAKRGTARAAKLTPEERKAIAKKAAKARWDKD
jgi:hypothetical protein